MNKAEIQDLLQLSADERYAYLLEQVVENGQIWILKGNGGSVLVGHDGQDSVPVWPHKEIARLHIHDDWSDCSCLAISLDDWQSRWTPGLTEDGLTIVGFMDDQDKGVVISPEEFDDDLFAAMQSDE